MAGKGWPGRAPGRAGRPGQDGGQDGRGRTAGRTAGQAGRLHRLPLQAGVPGCLWEHCVMSAAAPGSAPGGIERVEHVPVYGLVVDQLRRAIHNGSFVPGDRFPPERELSRQLGVSRASVREAIRVLEGEGYVETRRGASGGMVVLDRAQTEDRLAEIIRQQLPEIEQVIDFRLAVEGGAARPAAVR